MKRLESNLLNMVLSLTIVTLVAASLLGGMYVLTKEPISQAQAEKQTQAKIDVMTAEGEINFAEAQDVDGAKVYLANCNNLPAGAAVETFDPNGFNGKFSLMVGFDKEGVITGYTVLEQSETPGLGANMVQWFKTPKANQSIIGIDPSQTNMKVSKDGGDVDAITAATITSRAFLRAVNKAYNAYMAISAPMVTEDAEADVAEVMENVEVELVNTENNE